MSGLQIYMSPHHLCSASSSDHTHTHTHIPSHSLRDKSYRRSGALKEVGHVAEVSLGWEREIEGGRRESWRVSERERYGETEIETDGERN